MSETNLSGRWDGEFAYPPNWGPVTPFVAEIVDRGGHLSGSIIEPNSFASGTLSARIVGMRDGPGVDFTKTYSASGYPQYENPVDYVGTVSEQGNLIRGSWSLMDLDGTFEMRREIPNEVSLVVQSAETILELQDL